MALVFLARVIDFHATLMAMQRIGFAVLLLAVATIAMTVPLIAARWKYVLRVLGYDIGFPSLFQSTLSGFLLNQVLPTAIGGDVYRMNAARLHGVPTARAASSVIVDRMLGLFAAIVLLALGIALAGRSEIAAPSFAGKVALLCVAGAAGLLMLRFIPDTSASVLERLLVPLRALSRDIDDVLMTGWANTFIISISLVTQLIPVVCLYFLTQGAGVNLSLTSMLVVGPLAVLASALPLTFAGWGLREGALVYCLHSLAVDWTTAFAIALLFGFSTTLASLPGLITLAMPIAPAD